MICNFLRGDRGMELFRSLIFSGSLAPASSLRQSLVKDESFKGSERTTISAVEEIIYNIFHPEGD